MTDHTPPTRAEREPDIVFRTADHPEANGRKPLAGEREWTLTFPLDDGRILAVKVGEEGHRSFRGFMLHEELDDAADEAQA